MAAFPSITHGLLEKLNRPGPRYTSYPTAPVWSGAFGPGEYERHLDKAREKSADAPVSLYFHLPFCRERCTFCGCNVVVSSLQGKADRYIDSLDAEMGRVARLLGDRRTFSQLHFGGGTPTFLSERQLERLWHSIRSHFDPMAGAEIAVEIDPVVTAPEQLTLLRSFGFNRVSMGVQDFDPNVQHAIHRVQTVEQTTALVEHARGVGFSGVNFDLIYGLPRQTPRSWQQTIETVIGLRPDRVAAYSFAYLPELQKHQHRIESSEVPRGMEKLDLLKSAYDGFVTTGYRAIGIDHFALAHDELAIAQAERRLWRNFQGYTVKAAMDTIAFGTSAISDLCGAYAQNGKSLLRYYRATAARQFATERGCVLTADDRRRRDVITSLMCNFWVDLGGDYRTYFSEELEALGRLAGEGLLEVTGGEVSLTPLGRIFSRNVAMVFDAYLGRDGAGRFSMTV